MDEILKPCSFCDTGSRISYQCVNCSLITCESCIDCHRIAEHLIRRLNFPFQNRNIVNERQQPQQIEDNDSIRISSMNAYAHEQLKQHKCQLSEENAYCRTCSQLVCSKCSRTKLHEAHDQLTLDEAKRFAKQQAVIALHKLENYESIFQRQMLNNQSLLDDRLPKFANSVRNEIEREFREIHSLVELRKSVVLQLFEREYKLQTNWIWERNLGFSRAARESKRLVDDLCEKSTTIYADNYYLRILGSIEKHLRYYDQFLNSNDTISNDFSISFQATNCARIKELLPKIGEIRTKSSSIIKPIQRDVLVGTESTLLENQTGVAHKLSHQSTQRQSYLNAVLWKSPQNQLQLIPRNGNQNRKVSISASRKATTNGSLMVRKAATTLRVDVNGNWFQYVARFSGNGGCVPNPTLDGKFLTNLARPIYNVPQKVTIQKSIFERSSVTDNDKSSIVTFGDAGSQDGQLCRPWGICCDSNDNLYIADRSNNRIQIFSKEGKLIRKFGCSGKQEGEFDKPAGLALDTNGNIVVADKDNHRIQVFSTDGRFLLQFGSKGPRDGQFNYPWDVAVNSCNHIAVSDSRNYRVQLFTATGEFLMKFCFQLLGGTALKANEYVFPRGICFNPNGFLYVTDFDRHFIIVIDPSFTKSYTFSSEGKDLGCLQRPQGIVCDDSGRVAIADSKNNRIQLIDYNGDILGAIGSSVDAEPGTSMNAGRVAVVQEQKQPPIETLNRPCSLAIMSSGRIAVVDFGNNRIVIY